MHDVEFFAFPTQKKNPKGKRTWINLLRRKDHDPPRHHRVRFFCNISKLQGLSSYLLRVSVTLFSIYNFTIQMQVCSRHFEDGRPTTEKSIPYVVFIQQLQRTPEQQKWGSNQQTSMYYTQPTKKKRKARVRQTLEPVVYVSNGVLNEHFE